MDTICQILPVVCQCEHFNFTKHSPACSNVDNDSNYNTCWSYAARPVTAGEGTERVWAQVISYWEGNGLAFKLSLSLAAPLAFLLLAALNLFTLHVLRLISRSATHNSYRSHLALILLDCVLLFFGTVRFYFEFLNVTFFLFNHCVYPFTWLASFLEPFVISLLGTDQLIMLVVTLEHLLILRFPSTYLRLNSTLHALLIFLACNIVSVSMTMWTLRYEYTPPVSTCPVISFIPFIGPLWTSLWWRPWTSPTADAASMDTGDEAAKLELRPRPLQNLVALGLDPSASIVKGSDTYRDLVSDVRDLGRRGCHLKPPEQLSMNIYYVSSSVVSLGLLAASAALRREYRRRSEENQASEDEGRVSSVLYAEALLSIAQTLTSIVALSIHRPGIWMRLFGSYYQSVYPYFLVSCELVLTLIACFEMISHFVFFFVLSKQFRETALGLVRRCGLCKGSTEAALEAHTLHSVPNQRDLPKMANYAKNQDDLVLQDVTEHG